MTPGFILYMHREEYYDCNVTACKCFKCLLVLFFFPSVLPFICLFVVLFLFGLFFLFSS